MMPPRHDAVETRRWYRTSIGIVAAVFVLTAVCGFVLLPKLQREVQFASLWDAICSAAGVVRSSPSEAPASNGLPSDVVVTSNMLSARDEAAIGRGATLAQQCAICHGPTGVSRADSPNLAGQYAAVVFKQLRDFRSGARVNAVMTPFAVHLSDRDMSDLATYYAFLPRLPAFHPVAELPSPKIVTSGAPTRGIAPCGSCHGSLDNKTGSPWLEGQPEAYMKAQLLAFVSGSRRNDISSQMRNVARAMTPEEIDEAARYYASRPPEESASTF